MNTPLTLAEHAAPAQGFFGHRSNVQSVQASVSRITQVDGCRVPAGSFACRVAPQAAALAATAKPTVIVWKTRGCVTYANRNRDGTPAVQRGALHNYQWTRGEYRSVLTVGGPPAPVGELRVERAGRLLSSETLLAYTLSTPR